MGAAIFPCMGSYEAGSGDGTGESVAGRRGLRASSLVLVQECFELLQQGREDEAGCSFSAAVVREARQLLDADRKLESELGDDPMGLPPDGPAAITTESQAASLIGMDVAGFRIVELLGEGASGQVFLARQTTPSRKVALKLLWPCTREDAWAVRREAALLAPLEHSGIARLYQVGTWIHVGTVRPWLALEHVDGGRPLGAAATEQLSIRQRVSLLADVADALAYAHAAGVIHRDIKPGNVLLDRKGRPIVIDFGIAREDGTARGRTLTMLGDRIIGSLASIAPECLTPGVLADARADVFALGTIAFEVLTGRPMRRLEGTTVTQAIRAISMEDEAPRLGMVDRKLRGDLERIVAKATDPDPSRRYSSMALFAQDLRLHLASRPVMIEQQALAERVARSARRHWRAWAVAALLVVGLASATVVSARFGWAAREQAALASLSSAALAVESCDLQVLDRALAELGQSDGSFEAEVLRHVAALRGDRIAGGDWYALAAPPDGSWVVGGECRWATESDCAISRIDGGTATWHVPIDVSEINGVSVSPDGKYIASAGAEGGVTVLNAVDGSEAYRVDEKWPASCTKFLPDGRLAYMGESLAIIGPGSWDVMPCGETGLLSARAMASLPDGELAIGGDGGLVIVDTESGAHLRRLEFPEREVTALFADPVTGGLLATGRDRAVRFYPRGAVSASWIVRGQPEQVWGFAALPDGRVVSGGADGRIVRWDTETGVAEPMPGSPDVIWSLLSNDSGLFIGSSRALRVQRPGAIGRWLGEPAAFAAMITTARWSATLGHAGQLSIDHGSGPLEVPGARFTRITTALGGDALGALREDGVIVAIDARDGRTLWENRNFTPIEGELKEHGVRALAIDHHSGLMLVAAVNRGCVALRLESGKVAWVRRQARDTSAVGVGPDGSLFAADRDGFLDRLDRWGGVVASTRVQRGQPLCLITDTVGDRLLVGGADGRLHILDARTLAPRLSFRVSGQPIRWMWLAEGGVWLIDREGVARWR